MRSVADAGEEFSHGGCYFLYVGFEGEVAGVEELHFGVGNVAAEGFRAGRDEVEIKLAPDGEQWRLRLAEVLVEFWVELDVVGVVEEEIELDLDVAGARQQSRVKRVA